MHATFIRNENDTKIRPPARVTYVPSNYTEGTISRLWPMQGVAYISLSWHLQSVFDST